MALVKYDKAACIPEILKRISAGEGLRTICDSSDHLPSHTSFIDWVRDDPDLADHYARARIYQAEGYADEIMEIADVGSGDAQRDRLRVDTRKWYLSKVLPKVYGEKAATVNIDNRTQMAVAIDRTALDAMLKNPATRDAAMRLVEASEGVEVPDGAD